MSQRQGNDSGEAAECFSTVPALANASPFPADWVSYFSTLPNDRQKYLLNLAQQQGCLHPQQLPSALDESFARAKLTSALAGQLSPFPLVDHPTLFDTLLDEYQRDAVAQAIATPDLHVVVGPTGTGKTRTAIEIIRQVTQNGGKVLVTSSYSCRLNTLVQQLSQNSKLGIERRLGNSETIDQCEESIRGLVTSVRDGEILKSIAEHARKRLDQSEQTIAPLEHLLQSLPEFERLSATIREATSSLESLTAEEAKVSSEFDTASADTTLAQRLAGAQEELGKNLLANDQAVAEKQAARMSAEAQLQKAEADLAEIQPLQETLQKKNWLNLGYWKVKFDATIPARLAETESRLQSARQLREQIIAEEATLASARLVLQEQHQATRKQLLDEEQRRRVAEITERRLTLSGSLKTAQDQRTTQSERFRSAGFDATDSTITSRIEEQLTTARAEQSLAKDILSQVERDPSEILKPIHESVRLVVGLPETFAEESPTYELLVALDAHRLSEIEFLSVAKLARRWVLFGEELEERDSRKQAKPCWWTQLTGHVPLETWSQERNHLVCRLAAVPASDRRRLEREPVADAPEIELRLYSPPHGDPLLAEVAFPGNTPPAQAREFLARELDEITSFPRTRSIVWETSPEQITLRFAPGNPAATIATIGSGLREEMVALETTALHFATSEGWTVEQAKEWLAERLLHRLPRVTTRLARSYRACPGLAHWLNAAFDLGLNAPTPATDEPHVEFLAVPETDSRRRRDHSPRCGGAGYEIDLADARQRANIPPELQTSLPQEGLVNLLEAQALMRHLESLADLQVVASSPFPGQVQLMKNLVANSSRLNHVRVVEMSAAQGVEAEYLAVSLTRSHLSRAVSFGESPAHLANFLARAKRRLLIAGDPGTLARRLQWEGPVDHLDSHLSGRERHWVAALADCPRVAPHRPRHLAESTRP